MTTTLPAESDSAPGIAGLLRPHIRGFTTVVVLQVIGAVAGLAPLLAVAELGRILLAPAPIDSESVRLVVAAGAIGLFVRLLCTAASSGIGHILDDQVQLSFRHRLAEHLSRAPIGWFSGRRTGELAKVVGEDVGAVHPFIAHTPSELTSAFVVPVVSLIYLFTVDWRLTLITLIPVLLAVLLVPLMMTPARLREQAQFDEGMGRIADSVVEFVQGIAVVKAFGGAGRAHRRFRAATDGFADTFLRMVRGLAGVAAAMQVVLSPPFVLLVVSTGGMALITSGVMAPADLLPFLLLSLGLTAPVAALGHGFDDMQAARRALGRIADVLAVPALAEPDHPVAPSGHRVELRAVRFGYDADREVLRGIDLPGERFELLDDSLRELQRASRRSTLAALPGMIGSALTVQAIFTLLLALGAYLALGGRIGVAEVLTILVLAARCADPLLSLAELTGRMRKARAELARLDAVLRTEPLPRPAEPLRPVTHDVQFESMTFGQGNRIVLDAVSFTVPAGQRLALVGPSGAGKSTVLQVLARFYDVDSGAVRVGGVDVRAMDPEELMSRIAIVFQDAYLFDGTIAENVRLGRPGATDAEFAAAASAARLDEVVERLPGGWATTVGEGGALLSGGERQRVSIARALLADAPIVLLDEVTSALDPINEAAVHDGIERLMAGRTVVMVAHRLRTVRRADRIVVLDRGRIVEAGTHDELIRHGGRYNDLWHAAMTPTPH